jgi:hypothetical protein
MRRWWTLFLLYGCNVEALGGDTGGVPPGTGGPCPDGVTVVLSDYSSTQIALSALDGTTQSESFVSTASVRTDGLSFALSGDVVVPRQRPDSGRIVLIDSFGTNVLSFLEPTDGRVLAQLPLGTGFNANLRDYLEVDATRAYVSRFAQNQLPGREPFDQGSDVLIVDTRSPAILGRIELPSTPGFPAHPTGFQRLDERHVVLTLTRLSADLISGGESSSLIGLDTERDEIVWQLTLEGLKNCGSARLAPDGERLAVACTGLITDDGASRGIESSGLVLLDARSAPPRELWRRSAAELAGEALQSELGFATSDTLLFKTQTAVGGSSNRLLSLELTSGQVETLFTAAPDARGAGQGLTLGGIACAPGCSDFCLVTDQGAGALQRLRRNADGRLEHTDSLVVERRIGLPPVGLCYR